MVVKGKFSASAGADFSARGYDASLEIKDQNNVFIDYTDIVTRTNYLSFPLLGQFTFGEKTALRLSGGFVASVLVSAQRTTPYYNSGSTSIAYQTADVRAAYRSAELAALFQVGVYRKIGETWGAQFNFGYQQAFTKAHKNAGNAQALYVLPSLQLSVVKKIGANQITTSSKTPPSAAGFCRRRYR